MIRLRSLTFCERCIPLRHYAFFRGTCLPPRFDLSITHARRFHNAPKSYNALDETRKTRSTPGGRRSDRDHAARSANLEELFMSNSRRRTNKHSVQSRQDQNVISSPGDAQKLATLDSEIEVDVKAKTSTTSRSRIASTNPEKQSPGPISVRDFVSGFEQAVRNGNHSAAYQHWSKIREGLEKNKFSIGEARKIPYPTLLQQFFAMRQAEAAIEVWNFMVKQGRELKVEHWTAMLSGCAKAYDKTSLVQLWHKLGQTDLELDNAIWTVYVTGLIRCKDFEGGMQTLSQLGQYWDLGAHAQNMAKTETQTSLKPDLGPVHAVLQVLVDDGGQQDYLISVLEWATAHGLQPTTETYNIILKGQAEINDMEGVQETIAKMSTQRCEPTIITFTILLSSLISSPSTEFQHMDSKAQVSLITGILDQMIACGIQPNAVTYSAMLSSLLKASSSSSSSFSRSRTSLLNTDAILLAAQAVLNHMQTHNVPPGPAHYTMLLKHYLSLSPSPSTLRAIQSLWEGITSPSSPSKPDAFLYETMITGLSHNFGEHRFARRLMTEMVHAGHAANWAVLAMLLEDLVTAQEWEEARRLVAQVTPMKGNGTEVGGGSGAAVGELLRCGERSFRSRARWERAVQKVR